MNCERFEHHYTEKGPDEVLRAHAEDCRDCEERLLAFERIDELAADLKAWVKERLAPHKYPRWFEWRASLPKNDRGKVARKVLKEELAGRGGQA